MQVFEKLSATHFKEKAKEACRIIDLRGLDEFSTFHVPGSLYLNIHQHFEKNINHFVFPDQAILLVINEKDENIIFEKFEKLGFNNIKGVLQGGIHSWSEHGFPLDVVISISAEELMLEINHGHIQILDIRSKNEYDLKHLEDSDNIQLDYLVSDYEMIDKNSEICIMCTNGDESMSLISYLKINGIHNIYHVEGGFKELEESNYFKFEVSPDLN